MDKRAILLVEDNTDDAVLTLHAFEKNRILNHIILAGDGQEALDYLFGRGRFAGRSLDVLPALVLLDLKMPRMGGMEVLRRIRVDPRTRYLPVVVLTSSSEEKDIHDCYRLGANSFVSKPANFDRFCEIIRQLGEYWLRINELSLTPTPSPAQPLRQVGPVLAGF